ncbi:MAG: tRNA pseudouridine(38-40) synthase TruA [Bacteroidota bacterium]
MRHFVSISYDGTAYSGWQRQPNAITVQAVIEDKLSLLTGYPTDITGCGRTDAGVHSQGFVFHVDLSRGQFPLDTLRYKLDQMLPNSISVSAIRPVRHDAHARFDALSRSYVYHIHTKKDPFKGSYSSFLPLAKHADEDLLHQVGRLILRTTDFATFCKTKTDVKTTKCDVTESRWEIHDNQLSYYITANRFLRGMVRLIVGTSLQVALNKLSLADLERAVSIGEKPKHILSAPPNGLVLHKITYPDALYATDSSSS